MPNNKLSLKVKLSYGMGAFGYSITNALFLFFFNYYLTDIIGFIPIYATIIQLFRKVWDAINDPLVGYLTDRTRSRLGRRKPYILFGAIPFGFLFAMLWQAPTFEADMLNLLWLIVLIFLYDTAVTLVWVPYNALTPELTPDYNERTVLNGFRQVFSMIAGLAVGFFTEKIVTLYANPIEGYGAVGWIAGLAAALPFFLVYLGIKEKKVSTKVSRGAGNIVKLFKEVSYNKAFLIAVTLFFLSWVAVSVGATMIIYFIKHWLQMKDMVIVVLMVLQLAAMIAIPGIVWLSEKIGKKRTYIYGIGFWIIVQIGMLFLLPGQSQVWVIVLSLLGGIGIGAAHVIPWAMVPDCIDIDELETGQKREGMYYGIMTFIEKIGSGLALGGAMWVLQFSGYDGMAEVQEESALWAIRLLMSIIPVILLIISVIVATKYPLSLEKHLEIRKKLGR